jgi:hypothetical protein
MGGVYRPWSWMGWVGEWGGGGEGVRRVLVLKFPAPDAMVRVVC